MPPSDGYGDESSQLSALVLSKGDELSLSRLSELPPFDDDGPTSGSISSSSSTGSSKSTKETPRNYRKKPSANRPADHESFCGPGNVVGESKLTLIK